MRFGRFALLRLRAGEALEELLQEQGELRLARDKLLAWLKALEDEV